MAIESAKKFVKEFYENDETIELKAQDPELHFIIQPNGKNEYQIIPNQKIDILKHQFYNEL